MKVVMAVVSDISTDARVLKEAQTLRQAGWRVTIVGFDRMAGRSVSSRNGVEIIAYHLPRKGAMGRWCRLAVIAWSLLRAAACIGRSTADVFLSHNLHLSLPVWLRARSVGARLVYDAHELEALAHTGLSRRVIAAYEAWFRRRSDVCLTTNPSRAGHLDRTYGGTTLVLNNFPWRESAVPPVDLRAQLGIPADAPVLLFQGGFYLEARDFELVSAALAPRREWHWVLIGFGPVGVEAYLTALFDRHGIGDRAHVLPAVPPDQLLAYSSSCDVGVVPLNTVNENNMMGDTNKLFEYIVSGLAVIGTDFPELRRAILENPVGPLGAVYETGSLSSLGAAFDRVVSDLEQMRRNARIAEPYFTWESQEHVLVDAFRALAPGAGV